MTALTGVEIALWDIAGKVLDLPGYQLLGGRVRDRVRVYCDSGAREMIPGDERSNARIRQIREMGFTAAKIDGRSVSGMAACASASSKPTSAMAPSAKPCLASRFRNWAIPRLARAARVPTEHPAIRAASS